jgi:phosphoglycolate phosphatase
MKFLFDLDGTLMYKSYPGATLKQLIFAQTLENVFGVPDIDYMQYPIHGETDRSILRMVLRENGFSETDISHRESLFWDNFEKSFLSALKTRNTPVTEYSLLPGVMNFLEKTRSIHRGIATGNIEFIAWYKLEHTGIRDHFDFGGFGDDGIDRLDVVREAIRKSGASDGQPVFLFGDTPKDVTAGIESGCIVCAIATGSYPGPVLQKYLRPVDSVFDGFVDADAILKFCSDRSTGDKFS